MNPNALPARSQSQTQQKGFTIIELVVVIVILGIVSVTAASKFLNLQTDARISTLNGLKGGMEGASAMLYGKTSALGLDKAASASINVEGDNISVVYGYPAAMNDQTWSQLIESTFLDAVWDTGQADWFFTNTDANDGIILYAPSSRKKQDDNCYLEYQEATKENSPSFTLTTNGC
ncbi:prepilin-type N-terminal cleavage/methylation domain-containing protein [Vibrio splendidus]|uniref:prepilin-type N-terminal cleavage/methylation domain-containing protein n=1 Tax=Vibrio splendidus TaxID=29497 RepID=UPI000D3C8B79|nr:prepilin-type N-terminal cleavage/methylation domain-containing protein [Vibrio splendidus]PTO51695.1 MSHA biogenesis protein MshA [Vibrio splendidus]PTP95034.1 MSHA biogenesis protein MshA [Vibrio splendidus]